jgi:hypothetical protein
MTARVHGLIARKYAAVAKVHCAGSKTYEELLPATSQRVHTSTCASHLKKKDVS